MKIKDLSLEYIAELATRAGFKPTGNILLDTTTDYLLVKFAYEIGRALETPPGTPLP